MLAAVLLPGPFPGAVQALWHDPSYLLCSFQAQLLGTASLVWFLFRGIRTLWPVSCHLLYNFQAQMIAAVLL